MGLVTYTQTITGTINGVSHTFTGTCSSVIRNGYDHDLDVTNAWKIAVNDAAQPAIVFLANRGTEDALYRIKRNLNYYRLNLPAGKAVVIHKDNDLPLGDLGSDFVISLYSTNGTTIQVVVAY